MRASSTKRATFRDGGRDEGAQGGLYVRVGHAGRLGEAGPCIAAVLLQLAVHQPLHVGPVGGR
jgi:hypothetical protein